MTGNPRPTRSIWMEAARSTLQIALVVLAILLATVGGLIAYQRHFIYPLGFGNEPLPVAPAGFSVMRGDTPSGRLVVWTKAGRRDEPTLLFLHGNATGASGIAFLTKRYADAGWTIVAPEYPGYPGSAGTPTEAGLIDAAKLGWKIADAMGAKSEDVLVLGNSIGSGPAIAISAERRARGLVVVSGMASLPDVVRTRFPLGPDALIKDAYDNAVRIRSVRSPVMVIHGASDDLIPFPHGRRLAAAAGTPLVAVPGGHEIIALDLVHEKILKRFEK